MKRRFETLYPYAVFLLAGMLATLFASAGLAEKAGAKTRAGRVPSVATMSKSGPSSPMAKAGGDAGPARSWPRSIPPALLQSASDRSIAPLDSFAVLAVRINFSDMAFFPLPDSLNWFGNELEHAREYFLGASLGKLDLDYSLLDTIVTVSRPASYYGDDAAEDERVVELAREAFGLVDGIVDLAKFDSFLILHPGAGQETDILDNSPEQISSGYYGPEDLIDIHGGAPGSPFIATGDTVASGDSLFVDNFMIGPEYAFQDNQSFGSLGIYVRLIGSAMGMIALQDPSPSGDPDSFGIGNFGLMGFGFFNVGGLVPGFPCAFTRYLMGWLDPVVVENDAWLGIEDINDPNADTAAVLVPINEREYFLVVNRQHDENQDSLFTFLDDNLNYIPENGESFLDLEFDFFLTSATNPFTREENPFLPGQTRRRTVTGSGIYIWHIDEGTVVDFFTTGVLPNSNRRHKGVDLEEADGIQDLDNRGGSHALGSFHDSYRRENRDAFTPDTSPGSETSEFAETGISMARISSSGHSMTLRLEFGRRAEETRVSFVGEAGEFHLADLDGNDSLEVIVPADSGRIYLLTGNGRTYLDRDGDPTTIDPSLVAGTSVWVGPAAVGDVDGDGTPEIVAADASGDLWAWNAEDLSEVTDGDLNPGTTGVLRHLTPFASPPMLLQADADPALEIAIVARLGDSLAVHLLDGSTGNDDAPFFGGSWPHALRGDRSSNLALGRDFSSAPGLYSGLFVMTEIDSPRTGELHFLPTGVPGETPAGTWTDMAWSFPLGGFEGVAAGPSLVVGDIDGRRGEEAVMVVEGGEVMIFRPSEMRGAGSTVGSDSGPALVRVEVEGTRHSPPALFDLEGDGTLEIGIQSDRQTLVLEYNGAPATGFPRKISYSGRSPEGQVRFGSPLAAQFSATPGLEVLFPVFDGRLIGVSSTGERLPGWPRPGEANVESTPALADWDGDGDIDLITVGRFGVVQGVSVIVDSVFTRPVSSLRTIDLKESAGTIGGWTEAYGDPRNQARAESGALVPSGGLVQASSFYCYPNPVLGRTTRVRAMLNERATVQVAFYNLEGERVGPGGTFDANPLSTPNTPFDEEFDLGGLVSGIYFCRLEAESASERFAQIFTLAIKR